MAKPKNETLNWKTIATTDLTDAQIDVFGIRDFMYVSPATDKYRRTISVVYADKEDGSVVSGVTITGHIVSTGNAYADRQLKLMHSQAKKRLACVCFEKAFKEGNVSAGSDFAILSDSALKKLVMKQL